MVSPAPVVRSGAHLLYGKEEFLKREFIQKIHADLFQKSPAVETGFHQFTAPDDSLNALIEFLRSQSFFSTKKLAVFSGIDELEADDKERLLDLLGHLPADAVLVLVSDETNVKKDNFLRRLAEKAKPTPCHLPFDKDLPQWVEGRVRKLGKTIDRGASAVLVERAGKDAASIQTAIEQLTIYTHPETRISLKDVETLLGRSVQADVFGLLDALLEGKIRTALAILETLLKEGAKIYEITGAFSGQLERLGKVQALMAEGFPQDTIAEEMRLHPFFAGKIFQQAERISRPRLKNMIAQLLNCDEAVKTGKLGERLALERFVLTACA